MMAFMPMFSVPPGAVEQAVAVLQARFGERISVAHAVREQHGRGEGFDPGLAPDAVAWLADEHEVSAM